MESKRLIGKTVIDRIEIDDRKLFEISGFYLENGFRFAFSRLKLKRRNYNFSHRKTDREEID